MKRKKPLGPSGKAHEPTANNDQETDSKGKLGRRGFLKIGAGAAAVTLANPLESIAQHRTARRAQTPLSVSQECGDVPFTEPTKVSSCPIEGKNVLEYQLNAEKLDWTYVCAGKTLPGLQPVFNGALPGPSLYVDPGATLNLTLYNRLDQMPAFTGDNCPGGHHGDPTHPACFAHTNLHFHGLQVSPCSLKTDGSIQCGPYEIKDGNPPLKFSSDDVLVDVYPGKSNRYSVVLPDMHAPGTNWYHSHLHGASAYQISGGMAGALIIREPTEEARMVREDLDKVFLLQEILVNTPPPAGQPFPTPPQIYGALGGGKFQGTQFFVNGLCRPTLRMKKGQMMRWRFINTGVTPQALMSLKLVKTDSCSPTLPKPLPKGEVMNLIAIDGISFYGIPPQPVRFHLMGLGNRADFLVKLDQPGTYTLVKDGYPLKSVLDPFSTTYTSATGAGPTVLAYVYVEDSDYKDKIPDIVHGERPAYLQPIWNVDKDDQGRDLKQTVKFQNPAKGKFQINDNFYPANTDIKVNLNTAEEWTLQNFADGSAGIPQSNTHPFHVHLNPFQISGVTFDYEVDPADAPGRARMRKDDPCTWPFWDTVALPGAKPPSMTQPADPLVIRSRFLIYGGEYVTHCHILVHEDVGMMINVKLLADPKEMILPGEPVHEYPEKAKACIDRTSRPCQT